MPHCPLCLQPQVAGLARCPLDRSFYVERLCRQCRLELRVREKYCPACGESTENVLEQVVSHLPQAPIWRRLVSSAVDLLVLVMAVMCLAPRFGSWSYALGALCWLGYLMGFGSSGRQTLGQSLLGLTLLTCDERLAAPRMALAHGLLQSLWCLSLLLPLLGERGDFVRRWSSAREFVASAGS